METAACPACGRALDPLHAGQVAFVDGRFVYFCDREHKTQWLPSLAGIPRADVATAEPPVVEEEKPYDEAAAAFPDDEPRSMPIRRWASSDDAPTSMRVESVR